MSVSLNVNPLLTTTAAGLFDINSAGYVQGDAQADPNHKFNLAQAYLDPTAAAPIWAGMPVTETIPVAAAAGTGPGSNLGNMVDIATTDANTTAFVVGNQAFSGIITPQSPAPLFLPGGSVNIYRLGSGARVPLPATNALVAALLGEATNTQVIWNFSTNQLDVYSSGTALGVKAILLVSTTGNWVITYANGVATWGAGNLVLVQL